MATQQSSDTEQAAPRRAVEAAKRFVSGHGGSARAVVEHLGRGGARIVLIGADGALGDVMVSDPATGAAVVDQVEQLTHSEWDNDTAAALTIGPGHRRRMAGPRAR